ncbi:hypothetical protein [Nocardiopsis sp. CA-288880]|uniref:hypothetical protein n=1 Tax=Nocardiopsis sp. CA-288880 TaxID=3239995 RepID=UPI003D966294
MPAPTGKSTRAERLAQPLAREVAEQSASATYHQVWWSAADTVHFQRDHLPDWDMATGAYVDEATGEVLPTRDEGRMTRPSPLCPAPNRVCGRSLGPPLTSASLAIAAGADVEVVQAVLGHATAMMALDRYGHLFPDRLDKVADAMDAARAKALGTAA